MTIIPPLPPIEGNTDLLLDVFTHKSLRFEDAPLNDDYGDTDRLAELGRKVVDLIVTFHFFSKRPRLSADAIAQRKNEVLSSQTLNTWLDAYHLKAKLRCAPDYDHKLSDAQEIEQFFYTYVGAVYVTSGQPSIQTWLSRLIDPDQTDVSPPDLPPSYVPHPPANPAPPVPSPPSSSGSATAFAGLSAVAMVNQTASQKGFKVTYPASQTGSSHDPTWTVKCCLNDNERGMGTGRSQKTAREEAAKQAWVTMGWGARQ